MTSCHRSLRRSLPSPRALLGLACALAFALPAWAAEVVEVRVGRHPEFSRVVFELDQPAGYQVERRGNELVVTLDASARPRSIRSGSAGIERVDLAAGRGRSVATVRLRESGRLKEMILANPPRIVLDVMVEDAKLMAAKRRRATPRPAPVAKTPEPAPAPKPVAKTPEPAPAPKPVAKEPEPAPAPKPVAKEPTPEPAPKPVAKEPTPEPAPKPVAKQPEPEPLPEARVRTLEPEPAPTPVAVEESAAPEAKPETEAAARTQEPAPTAKTAKTETTRESETPRALAEAAVKASESEAGEAGPAGEALRARLAEAARSAKAAKAGTEAAGPEAPKGEAADAPAPDETAAKKEPAPSRAASRAPERGGALPGWLPDWLASPVVLGSGAGLLLCLLVVGLLVRRRRPLPNDLDVTAIADGEGGDAKQSAWDAALSTSPNDDALPDTLFQGSDEETAAKVAGPTDAPPSEAQASREIDSIFDAADAEVEAKGDEMSQEMSDFPADPSTPGRATPPAPAGPSGGGAPDNDVLRVVHELERRMAQLESKLAESNEARERLERQVAAQSEELRVQRAAIARTQRALRTLSRGDEDKATEPALREGDPQASTQAKTRVNV